MNKTMFKQIIAMLLALVMVFSSVDILPGRSTALAEEIPAAVEQPE